jgi:hypothetical protein
MVILMIALAFFYRVISNEKVQNFLILTISMFFYLCFNLIILFASIYLFVFLGNLMYFIFSLAIPLESILHELSKLRRQIAEELNIFPEEFRWETDSEVDYLLEVKMQSDPYERKITWLRKKIYRILSSLIGEDIFPEKIESLLLKLRNYFRDEEYYPGVPQDPYEEQKMEVIKEYSRLLHNFVNIKENFDIEGVRLLQEANRPYYYQWLQNAKLAGEISQTLPAAPLPHSENFRKYFNDFLSNTDIGTLSHEAFFEAACIGVQMELLNNDFSNKEMIPECFKDPNFRACLQADDFFVLAQRVITANYEHQGEMELTLRAHVESINADRSFVQVHGVLNPDYVRQSEVEMILRTRVEDHMWLRIISCWQQK